MTETYAVQIEHEGRTFRVRSEEIQDAARVEGELIASLNQRSALDDMEEALGKLSFALSLATGACNDLAKAIRKARPL